MDVDGIGSIVRRTQQTIRRGGLRPARLWCRDGRRDGGTAKDRRSKVVFVLVLVVGTWESTFMPRSRVGHVGGCVRRGSGQKGLGHGGSRRRSRRVVAVVVGISAGRFQTGGGHKRE